MARLSSVLVSGRLRSMLSSGTVDAARVSSTSGGGGGCSGGVGDSERGNTGGVFGVVGGHRVAAVQGEARRNCAALADRVQGADGWRWCEEVGGAGAAAAAGGGGGVGFHVGEAGGVGEPGETVNGLMVDGGDSAVLPAVSTPPTPPMHKTALLVPRRWQSEHCIKKRVTASRGRKA